MTDRTRELLESVLSYYEARASDLLRRNGVRATGRALLADADELRALLDLPREENDADLGARIRRDS